MTEPKETNLWNRSRLWIALGICLTLGTAGTIGWRWVKTPSVTYREFTVERGDLHQTILATGTVQPANRLEIKPPIAGRVEKILVQEGQTVSKGQTLAWMSSTERAALVDAARSQGEAELKKWEELYRPTPIIAPIDGTIILRNVESGQTFANTEPILVMADRLTVKAQVDETDLAEIKLKQSAQIILDAYSKTKIPAHVQQIAYEAKTVNNVTTYTVDILPEHTPRFMRSGMTANVTFFIHSKENVLLIPNEAIQLGKEKTTVLVRSPTGKPLERAIGIGATDGKRTEITSDLQEGEKILVAQSPARGSKPQATGPFAPAPNAHRGRAR